MALSNEEIKTARRLIAQYQKFSKQWQAWRWAILAMAFSILVMMAYGYYRMYQFEKITTVAHIVADSSPKNIGLVLDARINLLRREFGNYVGIILHGVVGLVLLWMVLFGWNSRGLQASLKAKLLEVALENELASNRASEFMKAEDS